MVLLNLPGLGYGKAQKYEDYRSYCVLTASTSTMFFSTSPVAAGLLTPFLPDCSSVPGAPTNSL